MTHTHCPHCGAALTDTLKARVFVDHDRLTAFIDGKEFRVTPRPLQILERLAAAAPNFVSTPNLVKALWGDLFISDPEASLRAHITRLRCQLADSDVWIESKQFHGYRLVLP